MHTIISLNETLGQAQIRDIYAHGAAEDLLEFDLIAEAEGNTHLSDGVTCVTVKNCILHRKEPGLAFVWTSDDGRKRGYVVLASDAPSIEFASKQMANRVSYI